MVKKYSDAELQRLPLVKEGQAPRKISLGGGLLLLISATSKRWHYRYAVPTGDGKYKDKQVPLGLFEDLSLEQARQLAEKQHALLESGVDPVVARKQQRAQRAATGGETFKEVFENWFKVKKTHWSASHADKVYSRVVRFCYPTVGDMQMRDITPALLSACVKKGSSPEVKHRLIYALNPLWKYWLGKLGAERKDCVNVTEGLSADIEYAANSNYPALLEPQQFSEFLHALDSLDSSRMAVSTALRLAPYLALRSGNLVALCWDWVDWERKHICIPASQMKGTKQRKNAGPDFIVPLAETPLRLLQELRGLNHPSNFVFPSRSDRHITTASLQQALASLGFKNLQTVHGLRACFRTMGELELNLDENLLEAQLAHVKRDGFAGAYRRLNAYDKLAERREMMEKWAAYLDALRNGSEKKRFVESLKQAA